MNDLNEFVIALVYEKKLPISLVYMCGHFMEHQSVGLCLRDKNQVACSCVACIKNTPVALHPVVQMMQLPCRSHCKVFNYSVKTMCLWLRVVSLFTQKRERDSKNGMFVLLPNSRLHFSNKVCTLLSCIGCENISTK